MWLDRAKRSEIGRSEIWAIHVARSRKFIKLLKGSNTLLSNFRGGNFVRLEIKIRILEVDHFKEFSFWFRNRKRQMHKNHTYVCSWEVMINGASHYVILTPTLTDGLCEGAYFFSSLRHFIFLMKLIQGHSRSKNWKRSEYHW